LIELLFADGKGIGEADLPHSLELSYTTHRAHGGAGLGLHVVVNLVSIGLGGQISVESQHGSGCRSCIEIPLCVDSPESRANEQASG